MTDRERIIDWLTDERVEAYRIIHPGKWVRLAWSDEDQQAWVWGRYGQPASSFVADLFVDIPPTAPWRPKPEPVVWEGKFADEFLRVTIEVIKE